MPIVSVKNFFIGEGQPLTIISGPCVIESEDHCLKSANVLKEIVSKYNVNFIFKSSYDKANRSSIHSYRGPGLEKGLRILERVQKELDLAVVTDVHSPEEAKAAGEVCDMIQIPAFLCRQTDLLEAAGRTGKSVQIKKGQFLAPWDIGNAVEKIVSTGNTKIVLVERGVSFGYNNLVSDMRSIPIMKSKTGFPVCFDATHSVQLPGGLGTSSGGQREFILPLAKAALAVGADALFLETHEKPEVALSDSAALLSFDQLRNSLKLFIQLYELVRNNEI